MTPDYLLLALVPIAAISGRVLGFLADWATFLTALLGWEATRGIVARAGFPVHTGGLHADQVIFGGSIPTVALQAWAVAHGLAGVLNPVTATVYLLHFPAAVVFGLILWFRHRPTFLRYAAALLLMSLAACLVFLLLPTAPPWWAAEHGQIAGLTRIMSTLLPHHLSAFYEALNPNPVAAVPSLHAAIPMLAFLAIRSVSKRVSWLILAYAALVWFSVVYLGEHYVADVVIGILWAAGAWYLVNRRLAVHLTRLRPGPAIAA